MIPEDLHYLFNDLGHHNLELSRMVLGIWQKWESFKTLMSKDNVHWEYYTERTIAPCEIVLDYDEYKCPVCSVLTSELRCSNCTNHINKKVRKELIKKLVKTRTTQLNKDGMKYKKYFTGSKGFHIHMIFPELNQYSKFRRQKLKTEIIKKYGGELIKASGRVMIMREGSKHRKTGLKKVLISQKLGFNALK